MAEAAPAEQPQQGEQAEVKKEVEIPFQTSAKKEESIQKALVEIENERNEKDELRRFGYFSIPYPATVGDQAYSQKEEYPNHKIVDGKVVIEKRGVYTMGPKWGRTNDVYFSVPDPISEEQMKEQKDLTIKEREDYINKVKARKAEQHHKEPFVPAGPKNMFAYYDGNENTKHEGPLTIEPDKKRFILGGGKVKTENRNIQTNPTKECGSFQPSDYFQFYMSDDKVQERLEVLGKKDIQDKLDKVKYNKEHPNLKAPFKPASLKKCEPFADIEHTFGLYNAQEIDERMKEYRDFKKNGNPKYKKVLPKGAIKHDQPFKPARLIALGREGLFNDDLYKIPEVQEEKKILSVKEKKELEEANKAKRRAPFTYNKLMKSSTFSPPISSFTMNLRREFPTIKFH